MDKERFMKDFNGEKIFSLEYDKETLKDMVLEKQEEIDRLNNIINKLEKYLIKIKETSTPQERIMAKFVLEYIEELKGSD